MTLPLPEQRFGAAEYQRQVWQVVLPQGGDYQAVFDPGYWAHVASRLKPGDLIEVRNDENTLFAMLYVRGVERMAAKLGEISHITFGEAVSVDLDDGYLVRWNGPHHRFAVIRKTDNEVIKSGFQLREDAEVWRLSHVKAMAA